MTTRSAEPAGLTRERFLLDVAGALRISVDDLAQVDDPFLAGLDSIRLMVLVESWRRHGVGVAFVDLVERRSLDAWWAMISASDVSRREGSAA